MVIVTTVTLDPVKEASYAEMLDRIDSFEIINQTTKTKTYRQLWYGEIGEMPMCGRKEDV